MERSSIFNCRSRGGVAGNLVKVDRNEQSRFFWGSVGGHGRVGSLLRSLVLLVRGKELFPERQLPRRRRKGRPLSCQEDGTESDTDCSTENGGTRERTALASSFGWEI